VWCPLIVVCDVGDSDRHIAREGTPGRGFNVNRVNSVGGDVLGRLGFELISIFVLGFVHDVRLMMAAGVDVDRV